MAPDEPIDHDADGEETDNLYCRSAQDFYALEPRFLILDLCQPFLDERKIVATELLHSPPRQLEFQRFFLRLTLLQRIAAIQAKQVGETPGVRFTELTQLEEAVSKTTAARARSGEPPPMNALAFENAVHKVLGTHSGFDARFAVDALLTHFLSPFTSFETKATRLLGLCPGEVPPLGIIAIDQILGEILALPSASRELFTGWISDYRVLLEILTDLWLGEPITLREAPPLIIQLARFLARHEAPACRKGLEISIHRTLRQDVRLAPISEVDLLGTTGLMNELLATANLAARLKRPGSFIGGKRTTQILDRRVSRLLSEDKLEDILKGRSFHAKLSFLFDLDAAVIGEYSQRIVTDYLQRLLDHREFASRLIDGVKGTQGRLRLLADVQQRVNTSSLPSSHRAIYATMLDEIQHTFLRTHGVFARFGKGKSPPVEDILELVALCADGVLTREKCLRWGQQLLRQYVRRAAFFRGFLASLRDQPDRGRKMADLNGKLRAAGAPLRDLTTLRVLLADDEEATRGYMEMILRDLGIAAITTAADGREAVDRFDGHEDDFDLIVADWKMPHVSGLGLLKHVRTVRPELPFLMVTALATLLAVEEAIAYDVTAYVAKPFEPEQLEEKVLILTNFRRDPLYGS